MRHQPQTEQLKTNAPIWKRLVSPSVPDMTVGNIAIIAVASVTIILLSFLVWPSQSTRDYAAPNVNTPELRFTDVRLKAYTGLSFALTENYGGIGIYSSSFTRPSSSSTGGVLLKGNVTNVTRDELFLIVAYPGSSNRRSAPYGLRMFTGDGRAREFESSPIVHGSKYTRGGKNNEFAGYYIKPAEKLKFELITIELELGSGQEQLELGLNWIAFNTATQEARTAYPDFHFVRDGSSLVFGDPKIEWEVRPSAFRTFRTGLDVAKAQEFGMRG